MWLIINRNQGDYRDTPSVQAESQASPSSRVSLRSAYSGVVLDLLSSRFGYVSISRASHEVTVFTDDMPKLRPQLNADVSKTSALEICQSSPIAYGIRMT
jgi:hypothetical protein